MNTKRAARLLYRQNAEARAATQQVSRTWETYTAVRSAGERGGKRRWKSGHTRKAAVERERHAHWKERACAIKKRNAHTFERTMRQLRHWLVDIGFDMAESAEQSEVWLHANGNVEIRYGGKGSPGGEGCGVFVLTPDQQLRVYSSPGSVLAHPRRHVLRSA